MKKIIFALVVLYFMLYLLFRYFSSSFCTSHVYVADTKNIFILFYFIFNYLFSPPQLAAHIYFIHLISNFFLTLSLTNIFSAISVFLSLSFLVFIFCLFPPNTYSHILLLVYFLVFFSHIAHISSLCHSLSLFILRRLHSTIFYN